MAEEIPVYLFTGFMDSGKTSLIKDTIFENDFANGSKGLIIMCEDGDVEYDMDKLKAANIQVAEIDSEDEFTAAKLNELNMQYLPEQVFIEYNGTWGIDKIIEAELPKGWVIVQSLATVDSTTFDLYMNNMRAMMQEQVFASDVVIFNRTDDDTDRGHLRRTIKNINRKAQIVYERKDGTIDERPEELPFDINQDVIELSDADYAIWYMDAMENYKKNDGKVYIGTMNAGLMGKLFGPLVGEVMGKVAEDQKKFVVFDPKTPAPKMIMPAPPAGATPGGSGGGGGGC